MLKLADFINQGENYTHKGETYKSLPLSNFFSVEGNMYRFVIQRHITHEKNILQGEDVDYYRLREPISFDYFTPINILKEKDLKIDEKYHGAMRKIIRVYNYKKYTVFFTMRSIYVMILDFKGEKIITKSHS